MVEVCALKDDWFAAVFAPQNGTGLERWVVALNQLVELWTDPSGGRLIKVSPSSQVLQIAVDAGSAPPTPVVCKLGQARGLIRKLGSYFRGPKEWREFWLGHRLRALQLMTPLPLAVLWRKLGHIYIQGCIVTRELPDAVPLDRAIRSLTAPRLDQHAGQPALSGLLDKLIELLCRMGASGYAHRDLKVSNILVTDLAGRPEPWLIDLDGVHRDREPFGPRFDKSLSRLVASLAETTMLPRTQWLRQFRAYLNRRALPAGNWKATWRRLQRQVDRRRGTELSMQLM